MQDSDVTGKGQPSWMVLFAGQGTAQVGMGAELVDRSAVTKQVVECASDVSGYDIRKLCLKGPMTRLTQTRYQQIAVTALNVASLVAIRESQPFSLSASAGHSAGEYSALWLAEVLTLEDLFKAITCRAEIMQRLATKHEGAMYHIQGLTSRELEQLISENAFTGQITQSCDNASDRKVIAGNTQVMKKFVHILMSRGVSPTKLGVNGAWHCELMAEGIDELRMVLGSLTFHSPAIPVYMNRTAKPAFSPAEIINNLAYHLTEPVLWRESMLNCQQDGHQYFLEISAKKYLLSLLDETPFPAKGYHCREIMAASGKELNLS